MKRWTKWNADTETTVCIVACIQFACHRSQIQYRKKLHQRERALCVCECVRKRRMGGRKKNKAHIIYLYIISLVNEDRSPNKASPIKQQTAKREIANIEHCMGSWIVFVCTNPYHTHIWIKWHGKLYSGILFTLRCVGHVWDTIRYDTKRYVYIKSNNNFERRCNWNYTHSRTGKVSLFFGTNFFVVVVAVVDSVRIISHY